MSRGSYRKLEELIKKAEELERKCNPALKDGKKGLDEDLTDFQRMKKKIAKDVAEVRQQISLRDEQAGKRSRDNSQRLETAKISADIRVTILSLRAQQEEMQKIHDENVRATIKGKKGCLTDEQNNFNEEVLKLVTEHLKEVEDLNRNRHDVGPITGISAPVKRHAVSSSLPDIDDPELLSALEGIKKKDAELDGKIDEIGKVVGRLGVLATEMNRELKVQEMMAQDLTEGVDKGTEMTEKVNAGIKFAFGQGGGTTKFVTNAILLVLVLGVVGYIVKMVTDGAGKK